jgi:hypothetical protein
MVQKGYFDQNDFQDPALDFENRYLSVIISGISSRLIIKIF